MEKDNHRKSFAFMFSYYDAIAECPDADRLACYDAIAKYGLLGEIQTDNLFANMILKLIIPNIDASNKRYDACVKNGKKGGATEGNSNASKKKQPKNNQTTTNIQPKNNQITTKKRGKNNLDVDVDVDVDKDVDVNIDVDVEIEEVQQYFDDLEVDKKFHEFLDQRPKKKNTKRSIQALINKMKPYSKEVQLETINNSIASCWDGLFPEAVNEKRLKTSNNPFAEVAGINDDNTEFAMNLW